MNQLWREDLSVTWRPGECTSSPSMFHFFLPLENGQFFSPFAYQREIYNDDNEEGMDDEGDDIDDNRDDIDDRDDRMHRRLNSQSGQHPLSHLTWHLWDGSRIEGTTVLDSNMA